MKNPLLPWQATTRCILVFLITLSARASAETAQELNAWTYHKEWDRLSNLNYSLARSPMPKQSLYDNLRLEIVCKDNRLQFVVDAKNLITSQGKKFDFDYQIDKNNAIPLQMKTFPDSKRRGFTEEQAGLIAEDLLSGQSVFIRVHTLISKVLSAAIPLNDAAEPIRQVLADCGIEPPGNDKAGPGFSLADFEAEFNRLSPEQKRQTLEKIKEIMEGFH